MSVIQFIKDTDRSRKDEGMQNTAGTLACIAVTSALAVAVMAILEQIGGSAEMMQHCQFGIKIAASTFLLSAGGALIAMALASKLLCQGCSARIDARIRALILALGLGIVTVGVALSIALFGPDGNTMHIANEVVTHSIEAIVALIGLSVTIKIIWDKFQVQRIHRQNQEIMERGEAD